ncbi:MAG: helix-turn-helix domain-containing protein [Lewinellaceae bacterium]|nr:helix-turn-helix domain-containing protein [Lewinellaceae bacterium]
MKLSVLILLDMRKDYDEIELILGIGRGTITNCRHKYDKDGLDKYLDRHYVPFSGKLSPEGSDRETSFEGIYCTSQEVRKLYFTGIWGRVFFKRGSIYFAENWILYTRKHRNYPGM